MSDLVSNENPFIPEELQGEVYHPGNDHHARIQKAVEDEIMNAIKGMDRTHIKIAEMRVEGISNRDIAKKLRKSQGTIGKIRKLPAVIRLESYLNEYKRFKNGPGLELLEKMLWRIAVDNEKKDPKESIKAIGEIAKMKAPKGGHVGGAQINIIIQHAALERGPLDG